VTRFYQVIREVAYRLGVRPLQMGDFLLNETRHSCDAWGEISSSLERRSDSSITDEVRIRRAGVTEALEAVETVSSPTPCVGRVGCVDRMVTISPAVTRRPVQSKRARGVQQVPEIQPNCMERHD
jgi:hypothetical protein